MGNVAAISARWLQASDISMTRPGGPVDMLISWDSSSLKSYSSEMLEFGSHFIKHKDKRLKAMPSPVEREFKMEDIPEEDVIRLAQDGIPTAFEQLYRRYSGRVYAICLRMVRIDSEAEDLTQEAFLLLFRKIHTFRGEARFSTWLHRLTINLVLMRLRKRRHPEVSLDAILEPGEDDSRPPVEFGAPDLRLNGVVDRMRLSDAVEQLPDGYKEMFLLHDVEGYEHHEIAEILGCSAGNSKSQLYKARVRLRKLLREPLRGHAEEKHPSARKVQVSERRDREFQCAKG
jgi:RNA polymerase sigma-70 factor (ECF subfamily)